MYTLQRLLYIQIYVNAYVYRLQWIDITYLFGNVSEKMFGAQDICKDNKHEGKERAVR